MTQTEATGRTGSLRPVLGASVLLFLSVLGIAGVKSSHDLDAALQRKLMLETSIQSTETEIGRLRNRIDRLRSDPGMLERHAREDLGMVRPGDVVIELPREEGRGKPAAPPPPVVVPAPIPNPPASVPPGGAGSMAKAANPGFVGPPAPPASVPAIAPPPPQPLEHP